MLTALVVEDDIAIQQLMRELLQEAGLERVHCASTAQEALEIAAETLPDIVILDNYLAGESGIDVAERLRALPGFSAPVLVTTALPKPKAAEVCAEAEACECVPKPFDITEFLAAVENCLEGHRTPAAA